MSQNAAVAPRPERAAIRCRNRAAAGPCRDGQDGGKQCEQCDEAGQAPSRGHATGSGLRPLHARSDVDRAPFGSGGENAAGDVDHVESHLARGPVGLVALDRVDEIGEADAAGVAGPKRLVRDVLPFLLPPPEPQRAAEAVRIGKRQDSFRPVDLELADVLIRGLEAGDQAGRHPARQLQQGRGVRGRLRREALAGTRADLDRPLVHPRRCEPGSPLDRTEERDERRQVVRAHVEQWSGTVGVEEVGVRVPAGLIADEHRRIRRERLADRTFVDQAAGTLISGTEEDVRRAAEPELTPALRRRPAPRLRLWSSQAVSPNRHACPH